MLPAVIIVNPVDTNPDVNGVVGATTISYFGSATGPTVIPFSIISSTTSYNVSALFFIVSSTVTELSIVCVDTA